MYSTKKIKQYAIIRQLKVHLNLKNMCNKQYAVYYIFHNTTVKIKGFETFFTQ